jgi:protein-tyrosine-phosphatase
MTAALRGLLPASVRRWRFLLATLAPAESRALLAEWWRIRNGRRTDWRVPLRGSRRVTFVCHGNIIRSPFAESAFRVLARVPGLEVRSAGVAATPGGPPDPRAVVSAGERGAPIAGHRAAPLDPLLVEESDTIFVMDRLNLARVLARHPRTAGRVFLLAGCEEGGRVGFAEIHDPVAGTLDDVRRSHDEVLRAVRRLVAVLPAA